MYRNLKLTAEQKCDIAQRELEEVKEDIEKLKDESERILDNYKVQDLDCCNPAFKKLYKEIIKMYQELQVLHIYCLI